MNIYQLTVLIIAAYFIFDRLKKKLTNKPGQSLLKVTATVLMWSTVIAITLSPHIFDGLTKKIGIGDSSSSIISLIVMFFLILFFKIISIIERIESNITEIVRKEALKDFENNK